MNFFMTTSYTHYKINLLHYKLTGFGSAIPEVRHSGVLYIVAHPFLTLTLTLIIFVTLT